jgi:hypothetical protein
VDLNRGEQMTYVFIASHARDRTIDPAARFQPDTRVHPAATVPNHPPPNPKPRKNQLS